MPTFSLTTFSFSRCVIGVLLCTLNISCAVGPNFEKPQGPLVSQYTETTMPEKTISAPIQIGEAQHFIKGKEISDQWWELFHSPSLNTLICKGLTNSPSVSAAYYALNTAQENYKVQFGNSLLPSFDLLGSANRQRFSGSNFGNDTTPPRTFNTFTTQITGSYNLDLFGGARRELEAFKALIDFQRFELEAAYLTLATNIVTTAISEASIREQIAATQELIQLQQTQLNITRQQFELGALSQTDVLTQESNLAQIIATLPSLEKNLAQTRHALAVLVGDLPSYQGRPEFYLSELDLPTELPVSLPSALVQQRPDIRASEALLHQASAKIGVATANLLPQISINGNYGWQSNFLNNLFSPQNVIWNLTGQVLQPLFHGGALLAQRRAAISAFMQARAQYQQTVLVAFQNVADILRALEYDAQSLKIQLDAERTAKKVFELNEQKYRLGAINYIVLLNANRDYQRALINRIQAQALRLGDTALLFQALGGGWWNRDIRGHS